MALFHHILFLSLDCHSYTVSNSLCFQWNADYDTNIQYHPGKANVVADALSRTSGMLAGIKVEEEIIRDLERRHDAIWVVVDRLTKSAHFLPIRKDYSVSRLAEIFQQEIVRLHGTPSSIVSDRDPRFASRFWKGLQKAWGTRLKFNTAFHPQTYVEFAYNNSWHASIKCAPFEMLYGWKCHAPICWDQVGERVIEGPEMIEVTNAKVAVAKEKLKESRTRQKSYADKHRRELEFQPGTIPSEKPLGKPRSLSGLLILISFQDM
nr:putative nucleotidyltransferase, ribonuclease H [Tanacetum cinerariifolium]